MVKSPKKTMNVVGARKEDPTDIITQDPTCAPKKVASSKDYSM
jgi:hypothetical protein